MNPIEAPPAHVLAHTDTPGGPAVLVLVHAFPLDREMWQPQLAHLSAVARVVTVDLHGFGESPLVPYSIDTAADLVIATLDGLGITGRVVVGGLSMGGYVAMAVARRHVWRLSGLILADTRAEADDEAARENRHKLLAVAQEKGTPGVVEAMVPKLLSPRTLEKRPEVVETVKQIGLRQPPEAVRYAIGVLRDRPDASNGLAVIGVPTLVIVGADDAVTPPAAAAAIAGRVKGSRQVTIPAAGHLSNLENPDAFTAAVLGFVAGLPRA